MGARSGGGGGSRGGGGTSNDFARDAITHPFIRQLQQKEFEKTMASIDANIKDPQMRAAMKAAVEKMYNEMGGLPQGYSIKLGTNKDVPSDGRPAVWMGLSKGDNIVLNKKYFGKGYAYADAVQKNRISFGTGTTTNQPALTTFVHEFGHGYYNRLSSAGKEQVKAVFNAFKSSSSTKGWGANSKTGHKEFYADAVAKAVLGGSDSWTKALGSIK